MNFIAKHIQLIGVILLLGFLSAAACIYWEVPWPSSSRAATSESEHQFTCPMHPQVVQAKPGDCPLCGMALVARSTSQSSHDGCAHDDAQGCCKKGATPTSGEAASSGCTRDVQTNSPSVAPKPSP